MEQQVAKRTEQAYPYRFFCEERYSAQAVRELICEAYEHLVTDRYEGGPIAVGTLASVMMGIFNNESIARMLIRGDYRGGELGDLFGNGEEIEELFRESKVPVDFFMEHVLSEYEFALSTDERYLAWFADDLHLALREQNLFFLSSEYDVYAHWYYYRGVLDGSFTTERVKSLRLLSECLVNCPIVEVW